MPQSNLEDERLIAFARQLAREDRLEIVVATASKQYCGVDLPLMETIDEVGAPSGDRDPAQRLAQATLSEVKGGNTLAPPARAVLSRVVDVHLPVIAVHDDTFTAPADGEWAFLNDDLAKERLRTVARATGRIECKVDGKLTYATGFLVGDQLLCTNRHVARAFCNGVGTKGLKKFREATVNFTEECERRAPERVEITEPVLIHPHWDWALLRIDAPASPRQHLVLDTEIPERLDGRAIAVVGHPKRSVSAGTINHQTSLLTCSDGVVRNGVKRIALGKLLSRQSVKDSFGNTCFVLTHNASTLPSNSGSPLVNLSTGRIVGIHAAGEGYLEPNHAVPSYELARDQRVADAGTAFYAVVDPTEEWDEKWRQADLDDPKANSPA
jgi:endonuclease G, mitochondrial